MTSLVDTARKAAQAQPGLGVCIVYSRRRCARNSGNPVLATVLAATEPVSPETLLLRTLRAPHPEERDLTTCLGCCLRRGRTAQTGSNPEAAADRYLQLLLTVLHSPAR